MTTVATPVRTRTATRTPPARRGVVRAPSPATRPTTRPTARDDASRATRPTARDEASRAGRPATRTTPNERTRVGKVGALLVVATIAALVLAVLFHVVLAQRQMELDHLNGQIAKAQTAYEKNQLTDSLFSSPEHVITEAQRLGLVLPAEPATYLGVPGAPQPSARSGEPSTTLDEYGKVKAELGTEQP